MGGGGESGSRRLGLRRVFWKIYITILLLLLVPLAVLALNGYMIDRSAADRSSRAAIDQNLEWGTYLAAEAADAVGPKRIFELFSKLPRDPEVDLFVRQDGRVFAPDGAQWSDDYLASNDGRDHLPIVSRTTSESGRTEAILVIRSVPSYHAWESRPRIFSLAVVAALVAIISYLLVRRYFGTIDTLWSVAKRISEGDLSARVPESVLKQNEETAYLGVMIDRMAEKIQRLVETQNSLLMDISHEIRSPLQRMDVAINLARRSEDPGEHLDRVEQEILLINEMVGEMLAFARADIPISEPADVDLGDIVRSVASDASFEGRVTGRDVIGDVEDVIIVGNGAMVRRAISSVAGNALRYTPPDSMIEISLTKSDDGRTAIVTVRDHGHSVTEDELERLFLPHYGKAREGQKTRRGTGLGLSITRRVAETHGGTATARLESDGGLVIELRLPIKPNA